LNIYCGWHDNLDATSETGREGMEAQKFTD